MTDTPRSDIAAALAYAEDHALADTIKLDDTRLLVRQRTAGGGEQWAGHSTADPRYPQRPSGTINVYDAESFEAAIDQRGPAVIYIDEATNNLTAVLNDDTTDRPGFRDYRVALLLRATPEWLAWSAGQNPGSQERFALRIEDGEREIQNPAAADMLELAQSFQANTDVRFKSGTRLQNGQHQLVYEETVNATAGASGAMKIPETFTLAMAPFVGSDIQRVEARLRYRIQSRGEGAGALTIGYTLIRPEDVQRDAFLTIAEEARGLLSHLVFVNGPAPDRAR